MGLGTTFCLKLPLYRDARPIESEVAPITHYFLPYLLRRRKGMSKTAESYNDPPKTIRFDKFRCC